MSNLLRPDGDDSEEETEEDWNQSLETLAPTYNQGTETVSKPTLPEGVSSCCSVHTRAIIHIDLDCFYAQVEMIRNPSLRNKPLGIQQKSIIVTCNYVARDRGLKKLMYLKEAQEKCPDMVIVNGEDLTNYREMSYKVTEILTAYSPVVERLGFDENFIDVTDLVELEKWKQLCKDTNLPGFLYDDGVSKDDTGVPCCTCEQRLRIAAHIAAAMRQQLYDDLCITSCAGIAHNKLLAKLVGETHKPNQQTLLPPAAAETLLLDLSSCRKIPGIGSSMAKKLSVLGVNSVADLRAVTMVTLEKEFGHKTGHLIKDFSMGIDNSTVTATGRPQTMSDEDSFKKCDNVADARERMAGLLDNLFKRLKEDGRVPQTVRLTVRKVSPTWHRESRQGPVPPAILSKLRQGKYDEAVRHLLDVCSELFHKLVPVHEPFHLTLINIAFAKLHDTSGGKQNISSFFQKAVKGCGSSSEKGSGLPIKGNAIQSKSVAEFKEERHSGILSPTNACSVQGPTSAQKDIRGCCLETVETEDNESKSDDFHGLSSNSCLHPNNTTVNPMKRPWETCGSGDTYVVKKVRTSVRSGFTSLDSVSEKLKTATSNDVSCNVSQQVDVEPERSVEAPPGVDPAVFWSLPPDIREDIWAEIDSRAKIRPDNNLVSAKSSHTKPTSTAVGPSPRTKPHCQGIIGFLRKPIPVDHSCVPSGGRDREPASAGHDRAVPPPSPAAGSPATNPDRPTRDGQAVFVPPDVDRDVFLSLPGQIQHELVTDWYRRHPPAAGHAGTNTALAAKQKTASISKYFRKT